MKLVYLVAAAIFVIMVGCCWGKRPRSTVAVPSTGMHRRPTTTDLGRMMRNRIQAIRSHRHSATDHSVAAAGLPTTPAADVAIVSAAAAAATGGGGDEEGIEEDSMLGQTFMRSNTSSTGLMAMLKKVSRPVRPDDIELYMGRHEGQKNDSTRGRESIAQLLVAADQATEERSMQLPSPAWFFGLPTNLSSGKIAAADLIVRLGPASASACVGWLSTTVIATSPSHAPRMLHSLLLREAGNCSDDCHIRADVTRLVKQWTATPSINYGLYVRVKSLVFHSTGTTVATSPRSCDVLLPGDLDKQVPTAVLDLSLRNVVADV